MEVTFQLNRKSRRALEKVYSKIKVDKGDCQDGCGKCCIADIDIAYIEFAYMIQGMDKEELYERFSEDLGKSEFDVCYFLNEDKSCAVYEYRPHICRITKRDETVNNCLTPRLKGRATLIAEIVAPPKSNKELVHNLKRKIRPLAISESERRRINKIDDTLKIPPELKMGYRAKQPQGYTAIKFPAWVEMWKKEMMEELF